MLSKDLDSAINAEVRRRQASFNAKLKPILEKAITSAVAWAISEALNGGGELKIAAPAKPVKRSRVRTNFRMSAETRKTIIEALKSGATVAVTAKKAGVAQSTVSRTKAAAILIGETFPLVSTMPGAKRDLVHSDVTDESRPPIAG